MSARRRLFAAVAVAAAPSFARAAAAEPAAVPSPPVASPAGAPLAAPPLRFHERAMEDRPHTFAEVEGGLLVLPGAPIGGRVGGDTPFGTIGKGDATLLTGVHVLWRGDPRFAIGAGARFCPSPTADTEYGGTSGLTRTHARSYLWLGAEGRYYALRGPRLSTWVGGNLGLIVVGDRYTTIGGDLAPTNYGTRDLYVASEGIAAAAEMGTTYALTPRWTLGGALRGDLWRLPTSRSCTLVGDCASLAGSVFAVELAFTIGYRIPL